MNRTQSNKAEGEERAMTQYWLGELSPEAEQRLEERYFADGDLFEQLLAVREELFDAYARGELNEPERERFEQRLLHSPEGREDLEFARSFTGALDSEVAANPSTPESAESPTASSPDPSSPNSPRENESPPEGAQDEGDARKP
jgi:anti-sigma factor RsiW